LLPSVELHETATRTQRGGTNLYRGSLPVYQNIAGDLKETLRREKKKDIKFVFYLG
jgi:hypothetical protein